MKNLYTVLHLEPPSNSEQIKKAFKFLATKYHPDKHDNDKFFADKFMEVKEAYDVLSNPTSKAQYDKELNDFLNPPKQDHSAPKPADSSTKMNESDQHEGYFKYIYWTEQWYNNGNWEKALEEIEKAIKEYPQVGYLYHIKGDIYRGISEPGAALKLYNKALERGDESAKADVVELESIRQNAVNEYQRMIYKGYPIYVVYVVAVGLSSASPYKLGYTAIACLLTTIAFVVHLRFGTRKTSPEVLKLLNGSWDAQLTVGCTLLAIFAVPLYAILT